MERRCYDTLSEAVNDLQKLGYTADFLISETGECLYCAGFDLELSPEEFFIDDIFRFEGMTDPGDESILFAISSKDNTIKGLVINSFGADFSYRSSRIVEELYKRSKYHN